MNQAILFSAVFLCFATPLQAAKQGSSSYKTDLKIVYAKHEGSKNNATSLDIYSPKVGANHPVMIYVHGGGWKIGDKSRVHLKPAWFTNQGYVLVSVNYRLHPQANWKQQAGDVAAAVRWVTENIHKHGGSPKKIHLMGHSAGAHLAALVATDATYFNAEKLKLNTLKSVVLLDGACYDIPLQIKRNPTGMARKLFESVFSKDEKQQIAASPAHHIQKKKGIPSFLILHVAGRPNSRAQSESLCKKLTNVGVRATLVPCQNKTHGTLNRELGKENDPPTIAISKFLKKLNS